MLNLAAGGLISPEVTIFTLDGARDGVEGPAHSQESLGVAFAAAAERKAKLTVLHASKLQSPYDDIIVSRVALEEWRESARLSPAGWCKSGSLAW